MAQAPPCESDHVGRLVAGPLCGVAEMVDCLNGGDEAWKSRNVFRQARLCTFLLLFSHKQSVSLSLKMLASVGLKNEAALPALCPHA